MKTFRGGVHPATHKSKTINKPIKAVPIPKKIVMPLLQHTGGACSPIAKIGQHVKRGQVIATSDKFISSSIHSSISGTVKAIGINPHPILGNYNAITIESDGEDQLDKSVKARENIDDLSADQIRAIIKEAGIVGLGGAAFPTHVKLNPPKEKPIDAVILNGAECEPYLTCDHQLMLEKPDEILKGLQIILKATSAANAYIGIESNKRDAALALDRSLRNTKIVLLKTKYPQGAEKNLIKAMLNREVPPRGLPFDVGCIVSNVGTAYAIYEAIYNSKPLYERVLTVSGSAIREPANLRVRIGTPVRDLIDICGGLKVDTYKVISGGPMMGIAQPSLDAPIIKGTSGILFLSSFDVDEDVEQPCIRCARCVDICPMNMIPTDISRLIQKSRYEDAVSYNIEDCVECGACSYECPSKIPLLQWIRIGKNELAKSKRAA